MSLTACPVVAFAMCAWLNAILSDSQLKDEETDRMPM
jgi:hypothetical protein